MAAQKGRHSRGGGAHQFYTGTTRDTNSPGLPTIATGMDLQAIASVMMPQMSKMFEAMLAGEPAKELDKDEINTEFGRLPHEPDENLR
jgi:hypothetical protein